VPAPSRGHAIAHVDKTKRDRQLLHFVRSLLIGFGGLSWLLPILRSTLPLGDVGRFLDGMFIMVCHRIPARSFALAGVDMPVCSRCAGVLAGLALGALITRPRPTLRQARWAIAVAIALMLANVVSQDLGLHPVWHSTRLVTGFAVGYIAAIALVAALLRRAQTPSAPPISVPDRRAESIR
jgi:uncharacterized membrane protein